MSILDRVKLINTLEKLFYQQAFDSFFNSKGVETNNIVKFMETDKDYLLKYYTNFTKSWLQYLSNDELLSMVQEKLENKNVHSNASFSNRN